VKEQVWREGMDFEAFVALLVAKLGQTQPT
jgi:hypothetical protein